VVHHVSAVEGAPSRETSKSARAFCHPDRDMIGGNGVVKSGACHAGGPPLICPRLLSSYYKKVYDGL
jgi:hypothetical protein